MYVADLIGSIARTTRSLFEHHAQQDRCTFFCGGTLEGWNYTNTATVNGLNGHGNWTFTYNYNVATIGSVGEATCWSCDQSGGGAVDVKFCGFVAGESFLKKARDNSGWDKKYSFTLTEPDPITGFASFSRDECNGNAPEVH